MPDLDVVLEVLTLDFALVNRWDPPQFPWRSFGINEVEGHQHLTATITVSAPDEASALQAAQRQLDLYVAEHEVLATRARLPDRRHADRRTKLTPWQRAHIEGALVDLLWDSREPLARVEITETATTVTITLYERRHPKTFGYVGGDGIYPRRARLKLTSPLGERSLLDGANNRAPDNLEIWDFDARALRSQMLTVDPADLHPLTVPEAMIHRR